MQRLLGKILTVVGVGVTVGVLTPACADNDQAIFVRMVLAPPTNRQNNMCIYTSDATQALLSQGILDIELRDSYTAALLVGSQLIGRGATLATRAEPNRVHLNGAVVHVSDVSGAVLGEFTSVASSFVDPQLNNQASYSPLVGVTLIDRAIKDQLATQIERYGSKLVVASIRVFGRTLGGVDVESGEFQFPITVCRGCLVSFVDGDDPAVDGKDCSIPLSGTVPPPCELGQDEIFPCQLCRGVPVCDGDW